MFKLELNTAINKSLFQLLISDIELLETKVYEVTVAHRIALYLEKFIYLEKVFLFFTDIYSVDLEYNKNIFEPKGINGMGIKIGNNTDQIRPDIIVHARQTNSANFLVIEIKRGSNIDNDYDKLKELTKLNQDYKYQHGLSIKINSDNSISKTWFEDGASVHKSTFSINNNIAKDILDDGSEIIYINSFYIKGFDGIGYYSPNFTKSFQFHNIILQNTSIEKLSKLEKFLEHYDCSNELHSAKINGNFFNRQIGDSIFIFANKKNDLKTSDISIIDISKNKQFNFFHHLNKLFTSVFFENKILILGNILGEINIYNYNEDKFIELTSFVAHKFCVSDIVLINGYVVTVGYNKCRGYRGDHLSFSEWSLKLWKINIDEKVELMDELVFFKDLNPKIFRDADSWDLKIGCLRTFSNKIYIFGSKFIIIVDILENKLIISNTLTRENPPPFTRLMASVTFINENTFLALNGDYSEYLTLYTIIGSTINEKSVAVGESYSNEDSKHICQYVYVKGVGIYYLTDFHLRFKKEKIVDGKYSFEDESKIVAKKDGEYFILSKNNKITWVKDDSIIIKKLN